MHLVNSATSVHCTIMYKDQGYPRKHSEELRSLTQNRQIIRLHSIYIYTEPSFFPAVDIFPVICIDLDLCWTCIMTNLDSSAIG